MSELIIGAGLPRLAETLRTRSAVIAYAGGSNTLRPAGWKLLMQQWFNERYAAHAPHKLVNAAIGANPSLTGCFLVAHYLLDRSPDLLFIEHTANDQNWYQRNDLGLDQIREGLESIIQYARRQLHGAEICLINYTTRWTLHLERDEVGDLYDDVAREYGLPAINVWRTFRRMMSQGVDVDALFEDSWHYSPEGLRVVGAHLSDGLQRILDGSSEDAMAGSSNGIARLKDPRICALKPDMITGEYESKAFQSSVFPTPEPYYTLRRPSTIRFKVHGDLFGLYAVAHEQSGCIACHAGGSTEYMSLYDMWCTMMKKPRLKACLLPRPIALDGETVTVEVLADAPPLPRFGYSQPPITKPCDWTMDMIGVMVDGTIRA